MNFIFISPNFPHTYWNFCDRLKKNGVNVLGIGDASYDGLEDGLKGALTEYFKVDSLENYDQVFGAVAFFSYKYGKIDWIETNNEYWLLRDARLRDEFNINTGLRSADMEAVKYKSKMKANYIKVGIPVARYHIVDDLEGCRSFIDEVGYPVIAKPDNGVGANDTYKIRNEDDLRSFFETRPDVTYIMEEFITGEVQSYDAIINSRGEPLLENGNVTVASLMDVVNEKGNTVFYERSILPEDILDAGRRTVRAFGIKSRFVHLEFFRLTRDQHLGKKGDIVALEVNMRPPGGIAPSMMNWASGTDVYKIWADMVAFDGTSVDMKDREVCCFASRRDGHQFVMSPEEVREKYGCCMKQEGRVEEALSGAMANYMFVANFPTEEEARAFAIDVLREV